MSTLIQDLRYELRRLRRNPGFAAIALLTIALGIGATTAMFSVVNAVLLRPLPFPNAGRLIAVGEYDARHTNPGQTNFSNVNFGMSYPDVRDIRNRNHTLSHVAVYDSNEAALTGLGEPLHVNLSRVSADLFPLLGVQPYLGRGFTPDEDKPGHYVAIASYRFWRSHLNGSPGSIGRNIDLNGRSYSIVGVMPAGFQFPVESEAHDLWITLSRAAEVDAPGDTPLTEQRGARFFGAVASLADGVTLANANADLESIGQALAREYPGTSAHNGISAVSEMEFVVGDVSRPLLVLLAAVGLVLLIACVNVANLLLVRGSDRLREIGVRGALGATRWRLIRQLVSESVLLSVAGSALGIVLASWLLSALLNLYPENLPRAAEIGIDLNVVGFSAAIAVLTGILFGLVPSFRATSLGLSENLRSVGRTMTSGTFHSRLRSGLVIGEMAVGVMLLIGAGLLLRSFHRLSHADPGFDPNHLLTCKFDLSETRYNPDQQDRFVHDFLGRLQALPGVVSASAAMPLPLSGNHWTISFNLVDHPVPRENEPAESFYVVSPGFFETMRMPLMRGRVFDQRDQRNSEPVMVISAAFARKYFPNDDPIGKRITIGAGEGALRARYKTREVIGVVGDLRTSNLEHEPGPSYYVPLPQLMWAPPTVVVRSAGDPMVLAPEIGKVLQEMEPASPLYSIRSMTDYLALDLGRARFQTLLLGLFAAIALLLTVVGLYGVMAQSVTQRTHEIGIRLAMGATQQNVRAMILRRGTLLGVAGTTIGVTGALAFAKVIESLLYETPARDPATYFGVCAILCLVAAAASYVPARRATRVDPMVALRYE